MKTGLLITLTIIYNIAFSSLNGPYFGIEFGHTHFKVTETQTFTDVPLPPDSPSTMSPSPSSCSSPHLDRSASTSPLGFAPSHISNQNVSERSESIVPHSSSNGGYSPKELSSASQSPIPTVIYPASDSSSLHSTPAQDATTINSVSKSPLILNPTPSPKIISTSNSDTSFAEVIPSNSSLSFVSVPSSKVSSSLSFAEVSSETNEFDFSYHQSASSGDEKSSNKKLHQSNKTIPTLIKSLSPICHAQQRNYKTPSRLYPTFFFKTGYGDTIGIVYVGSIFKIGQTLSFNRTVPLIHRWNLGGDIRVGFYITDDCLAYVKLGVDRDKLVLYKRTDLYLWSFAKGIGIDHRLDENVFLSLTIDHSKAFHYTSPIKIVESKTSAISLRTGMGFMI